MYVCVCVSTVKHKYTLLQFCIMHNKTLQVFFTVDHIKHWLNDSVCSMCVKQNMLDTFNYYNAAIIY